MLTKQEISTEYEARKAILTHFEEIKQIAGEWNLGLPRDFVLEDWDIVEKWNNSDCHGEHYFPESQWQESNC